MPLIKDMDRTYFVVPLVHKADWGKISATVKGFLQEPGYSAVYDRNTRVWFITVWDDETLKRVSFIADQIRDFGGKFYTTKEI